MPNGAKNWCFTLNNYTDDEVALLQALAQDPGCGCLYMVFGREVGESGTPHLQGFFSLDKRRSLSYVREMVSVRGHYEMAKGSPAQAADYCKKDGDYEEYGTKPKGKGSRTDLIALKDAIQNGATEREIINDHFGAYSRAFKAANRAMLLYAKPRNWVTTVEVYWGDTGLGKTRKAMEECGENTPYMHPGGQWFDGYDGENNVIFDDYGGHELALTYLLKLLDRYPMRVPVKGGFVNWIPKTIYITSNRDPKTWYANANEKHQAALMRRITKITHFSNPFPSPA